MRPPRKGRVGTSRGSSPELDGVAEGAAKPPPGHRKADRAPRVRVKAKKVVRHARRGDANYLDPTYYAVPKAGENWVQARTTQIEAIKAAEAKTAAKRAAQAAKRKASQKVLRARVEATTDLINAGGGERPRPLDTTPQVAPARGGTMPYQDNSPLATPARVRGNHDGKASPTSTLKEHRQPGGTSSEILSRSRLGLRQAFPELIPARPYCCNDPEDGIRVLPRELALTHRHVQFNGPSAVRWLIFDIDRPGAYLADDEATLPAFNVVMVNKANRHAHVAYLLDVPVARHDMARSKPLKYLAAIERGLTRRLGGDRGYRGLLAKNPLHAWWEVEWRRDGPYALEDLGGWLSKEDMRLDAEFASFGLGRNCQIFDDLRAFAYREVLAFKRMGRSIEAWRSRLFNVALNMNGQFVEPLSDLEVRGIAKSVAKWTWKHFTEEGFAAIQSKRAQIRWRGHEAESTTKPWLKLGISRRTHYRRKKRAR